MDNLALVHGMPDLAVMPMNDVIDFFTSNYDNENTAHTYDSALRSFFAWTNKDYREVNAFDALSYNAYLKQNYSASTVQNRITALKTFFGFVVKAELITKNPFAIVRQKGVPNRVSEKFLTTKEIDRLLTALHDAGEKHYILGLLLASTGARISEIQELSWKSFLEMPDGSISVGLHRKGDEYQLLALRDDVWQAVKSFMGKELNNTDENPVFLNPSHERISVVSLRQWVKDAAKQAGITKNVTPHTLRHSFCSNTLAAGADLRDVQVFMNHKSILTTQIYMHGQNQKVGEFLNIKVR